MNNIIKRKCCRCKVTKPENMFSTKKSGEYKKTCDKCLTARKVYDRKRKCIHSKQRTRCDECKGEYIEVSAKLIEMMNAYL